MQTYNEITLIDSNIKINKNQRPNDKILHCQLQHTAVNQIPTNFSHKLNSCWHKLKVQHCINTRSFA